MTVVTRSPPARSARKICIPELDEWHRALRPAEAARSAPAREPSKIIGRPEVEPGALVNTRRAAGNANGPKWADSIPFGSSSRKTSHCLRRSLADCFAWTNKELAGWLAGGLARAENTTAEGLFEAGRQIEPPPPLPRRLSRAARHPLSPSGVCFPSDLDTEPTPRSDPKAIRGFIGRARADQYQFKAIARPVPPAFWRWGATFCARPASGRPLSPRPGLNGQRLARLGLNGGRRKIFGLGAALVRPAESIMRERPADPIWAGGWLAVEDPARLAGGSGG